MLPALASQTPRHLAIAGGVALLHLGALWALNSGLTRRHAEQLVPVTLISEVIITARATAPSPVGQVASPHPVPAPPAANPRPPTPATKTTPERLPAAAGLPTTPAPTPAPNATPTPVPASTAPVGAALPGPAPAQIQVPADAVPGAGLRTLPAPPPVLAIAAPPAPVLLALPSSDADYLQNPKPVYPPVSKRLGEQGKVVVRVLIGADGMAQRGEIRQSSGFDRLDQAARSTALRWRYLPGTRGGVPEAMWFDVPINFVLE